MFVIMCNFRLKPIRTENIFGIISESSFSVYVSLRSACNKCQKRESFAKSQFQLDLTEANERSDGFER